MALITIALFAGVVAYAVIVARLSKDLRRDSAYWSYFWVSILVTSVAINAAYLIPAWFGQELGTAVSDILETPMQRPARYYSLYVLSYFGISLGLLAAAHRRLFARRSRKSVGGA